MSVNNKYRKQVEFIEKYRDAINAASGSEVDANANIASKNIATLCYELPKKLYIGTNRLLMHDKITELYGESLADEYICELENHIIYKHDETSPYPYCVSITMYPFIFNGLKDLGGISEPPKNLNSFCGSFINLVYAVGAQFAGAVATPEFLTYLDYFIRKEFGNDYYKYSEFPAQNIMHNGEIIKSRTIKKVITECFEQVVYSINQPAAARGFQSLFWNLAYFDKPYFHAIFKDFVFPDGDEPQWESVSWLQKLFMKWFNHERLRAELTYPVETINLLNDGEKAVDQEWFDFACEMYAEGHSFFTYTSDSVDSLSSCCRVRNGITNNTFSYTLGAGGVATGSKSVITMNLNRIIQNLYREKPDATFDDISETVRAQVKKIHKYQTAFNEIMKDNFSAHLLPVYEAGFISMSSQYLTIGINGGVEAAEFLGIDISPNAKYFKFWESILKPIREENLAARTDELMFNTEYVPAENLGVKNAMWDKEDGYFVPRDCYNSYFYRVEDETLNLIDKIVIHGKKLTKYLDGGSALHENLSEHLSKEQYIKVLLIAIKEGCSYLTFNIPNTVCNKCGHISKHYMDKCEKCGSDDVDYMTRIIGYLKRISKFSQQRMIEAGKRYYHGKTEV